MKKKLTAVEWFYGKWSEQGTLYLEDLEQAKQMEKEQMKEAYSMGRCNKSIKEFNETFKSE